MNEIGSIIEAWEKIGHSGASAVIATVVYVEGSAYRRPGARMFISSEGVRVGTISGGCLEGDVSKKAWWLTEDGKATVRVYDTTSEDAVWEFGLGCNGVIKLLLERTGTRNAEDSLRFLQQCLVARQPGIIATVIRNSTARVAFPYEVGDRLMVNESGIQGGTLQGSPIASELLYAAQSALKRRASCRVEIQGIEIFVECVLPPIQLNIFGAGHDAIPLVAIAKQLGWRVTISDGRPTYNKKERFPGIDSIHLIPASDFDSSYVEPNSAVVLMTHNYPQDRSLLRHLLPLRPTYLGILGPRKRAVRMLAEIGGGSFIGDLHAPAGLDIGADNPHSIALSIVAEINATFAARQGGKLRLRQAPIYEPDQNGEVVLPQLVA